MIKTKDVSYEEFSNLYAEARAAIGLKSKYGIGDIISKLTKGFDPEKGGKWSKQSVGIQISHKDNSWEIKYDLDDLRKSPASTPPDIKEHERLCRIYKNIDFISTSLSDEELKEITEGIVLEEM